MEFFDVNFAWIAPSTALILLVRGRWREFRATTMGVLVCFYLGYALYVALPAAPPRLVLVYEFTKSLEGYPRLFSSMSAQAFALLPVDSRGAFPSLHSAVSLVALAYAWRYLRWWFWALLPLCLGLWVSTVYLRHHYVVDLFAGLVGAPAGGDGLPAGARCGDGRQRAGGAAALRSVDQLSLPQVSVMRDRPSTAGSRPMRKRSIASRAGALRSGMRATSWSFTFA
jgi:hypothetical protein